MARKRVTNSVPLSDVFHDPDKVSDAVMHPVNGANNSLVIDVGHVALAARGLEPLDPDDPRVVELGRQMIQAVKAQAGRERDAYRELLEARVAGLEALLTAIVRQIPAKVRVDEPTLDANCWKALRYLDGSGPL